jgi:hypothetical protein
MLMSNHKYKKINFTLKRTQARFDFTKTTSEKLPRTNLNEEFFPGDICILPIYKRFFDSGKSGLSPPVKKLKRQFLDLKKAQSLARGFSEFKNSPNPL